ncbi:DUF721 domain-containing protein [Nitrosospira lacus]|uniref:DUF721 domain-containing protein n=1 Tax=Nitrosospira lacus TaxID=1288494 RepID=A0A1W6SKU9_9PROT|nr:DUF721 domain-containing protein [Nitrosospira lacus]ARO86427.1 DUF721 domain-containing protein [Nitrosospira lacus]
MAARKITFYLGALSTMSDHQRLFGYLDKLTAMQRVFMDIAPPQLAQRCTLGGFFEGNLTLCAHNGAIAAKLRQILPSLLLKFRARGYEVTAIRVTVQADYRSVTGHGLSANGPAGKQKIGQAGVKSLIGLAAELPPSPLKTAVESLLKKQND